MKSSIIPMICGVTLAAVSAASFGHWWTVREFVTAAHHGLPMLAVPQPHPELPKAKTPETPPSISTMLAVNSSKNSEPEVPSQAQKEFFESLVKEVKTLHGENLKLVDQMAETNRSIMQLEFRVDTHSESFRPLPISEEGSDISSSDYDGQGVLPPRAVPIRSLTDE